MGLNQKLQHLELQVKNRDKEIDRLQSKLDVTGLNTDKIANDFNLKSAQEKIEKLNSQIDFLSRQNFSLEDQSKTMKKDLSRTDNLRSENRNLNELVNELKQKVEDLRVSLKESERTIERVKASKNIEMDNIVEAKNKNLDDLKSQVNTLRENIAELEQENRLLKEKSSNAGTS